MSSWIGKHPEGQQRNKSVTTGLTLASRWLATTSPIFVYGASRIKASTTDPDIKDSNKMIKNRLFVDCWLRCNKTNTRRVREMSIKQSLQALTALRRGLITCFNMVMQSLERLQPTLLLYFHCSVGRHPTRKHKSCQLSLLVSRTVGITGWRVWRETDPEPSECPHRQTRPPLLRFFTQWYR